MQRRRYAWIGGAAAAGALAALFGMGAYSRVHGAFDGRKPAVGGRKPAAKTPDQRPSTAGFRPSTPTFPAPELRFGDRWVVMVRAALPQEVDAWQPEDAWQFTAVGVRPDEVVVEARPVQRPGVDPVTLLIDPQTGRLLRTRVVVPANFGPKLIDRRYEANQPGLVEMTPIPVDRPAFPLLLPARAKGGAAQPPSETRYESVQPAAPGRVQFGGKVIQRVYHCDAKTGAQTVARGLREAGTAWRGKLPAPPACRVELVAPGGEKIEQLWAPGIPWPLYTATATTRSWLVDFQRHRKEG